MNIKRLIMSGGMLAFVAAVVIGSTGAFFSDTETSAGNVFTAGSVTIEINDIVHQGNHPDNVVGFTTATSGLSFAFADLKPLDNGTVTFNLKNGANEAYVCAMVEEKSNNDNGINDPEAAAGDATNGPGNGELGQFLSFKFGSQTGTLANVSGLWQNVLPQPVPAGGTPASAIGYCFGTYSGNNCVLGAGNYNLAQTDSLTADVKFYAVQTRNNPNFTCASLNEPTWVETNQDEGDADFVQDPSNLNKGTVLRLTTGTENNSRVRWTNDSLNYNLSTLTGISYDAYRISAIDLVNGNASMRLMIDLDGDLNTADVQEIVYEPYYNIVAHNPNGPASIMSNVWQTWPANLTNGKFWANGGFLGSTPNGGAYATNFTLGDVLAAHANSKIVGISLGMGTWNPGQVVLVDDLVINGSTISLEN